ncbi:MAG: NADH dehydrogenase (quinone) subunit D [Acidobacteriota bacterium]
MGPQHPATHGVLRLVLKLDGETVTRCKVHIGYLHRGVEKIGENKTFLQFIPYTDRLDYLAPLSSNVGYILAVEKLMDIQVPERCRIIRVIACEIARISAHLLWLGTHALDLGAVTLFFYTFREREVLYNLIEMLTGARLTTSYTRVGGLARDLPDGFVPMLKEWAGAFGSKVDEFERLLTRNRIWVDRTKNVGVIPKDLAVSLALTGPNLRASGLPLDLRKTQPYSGYDEYDFEVPYTTDGDVYARYMVRVEEMRQSLRILSQAVGRLRPGPIWADHPKVVPPLKRKVLTRMDELIHHFMIISEGMNPPVGEVYHSIEAPKGELGFYIVSDGGKTAYRLHIRSPSFVNLKVLEKICVGAMVSDVIAIIASLDPVMGEVDR